MAELLDKIFKMKSLISSEEQSSEEKNNGSPFSFQNTIKAAL
jgi:hypothetical protein